MFYDVGFLWILEETCIAKIGKRGMFENECTQTLENKEFFEKWCFGKRGILEFECIKNIAKRGMFENERIEAKKMQEFWKWMHDK